MRGCGPPSLLMGGLNSGWTKGPPPCDPSPMKLEKSGPLPLGGPSPRRPGWISLPPKPREKRSDPRPEKLISETQKRKVQSSLEGLDPLLSKGVGSTAISNPGVESEGTDAEGVEPK